MYVHAIHMKYWCSISSCQLESGQSPNEVLLSPRYFQLIIFKKTLTRWRSQWTNASGQKSRFENQHTIIVVTYILILAFVE